MIKHIIQNIFSVKNNNFHKIITLFGIKIKFKINSKVLATYMEKQFSIINKNNATIMQRLNECNKKLSYIDKLNIERKIFWNTPGVWNFLGGNFKQYIIQNNMLDVINKLKNNLDNESQNLVDNLYERLILFPNLEDYDCFIGDFKKVQEKYQLPEERLMKESYSAEKDEYRQKYKFSTEYGFNGDVFYYHHGLRFSNNKIKEYIKNKDFIDGGAFIGDSALILQEYNPKKIYSFELMKEFCSNYKTNMELNNIPANRYEILCNGISDKISKTSISINSSFNQRQSLCNNGNVKVDLIDIDYFANSKNLNVGFIKLDIEGAEMDALEGMIQTIQNNRPVLSIAIYHNPIQFFELKPRLEEITKDLNYKFEIKKLEGNIYHPLIETVLFAYPSELFGEF